MKEVHFGTVVDNVDPEARGGLKVRVDTLLDQLPLLESYIPPAFPFAGNGVGFFFVPEVGAQVEVEVEADPEKSVEDLNARWRGVLYSQNDPVPSEFTSDYPNRAGIKFGDLVVTFDRTQDVAAIVGDNVRLGEESASHPVMRGDTYNSAEDAYLSSEDGFLTALSGALSTWSGLPPGPATNASLTAFAAALTASLASYQGAVGTFRGSQNSWLSTKVRTE